MDIRLCCSRVGMALSADWVRPSRLSLTLGGAAMGVKRGAEQDDRGPTSARRPGIDRKRARS